MPEERIEELLEQRDFKQLKLELEDMYPVDLAEIMEELTDKQVVLIFRLLPKEEAKRDFFVYECGDASSVDRCTDGFGITGSHGRDVY